MNSRKRFAAKGQIRQAIFSGMANSDGARVDFVSLDDGRCALLRDGQFVAAWGNDMYGIDDGVRRFLEMTNVVQPRGRGEKIATRAMTRSQPSRRTDNSRTLHDFKRLKVEINEP